MDSLTRNLFGGAITAETPTNLIDASDFRQVPDNQEVFLYPDSNISIIVEILEKVEPTDSETAIRFHFGSLAHDNSAVGATVNEVTILPNDRGDDTPSTILLSGVQSVPKFNRTKPDEVQILMALYRIEQKDIDLVVTFNIPIKTEDDEGAVPSEREAIARKQFDAFARSLKIVNYGLFV